MRLRFKTTWEWIIAAGLCVALIGLFGGWHCLRGAKQENQRLQIELEALFAGSESSHLRQPDEEGAGLNKGSSEISKLRNELSQLKARATEYEELKAENDFLKRNLISASSHTNQLFTWITSVRVKGVALDDVDNLVVAMKQENTEVRVEAAKALRTIGLELMLNTNLTVEAQEQWRAAGLKAIPSLLEALNDQDVFVRVNAAITLGFFRLEPERVVPALVSMLDDGEARAARSAAKALSRLQQLALPAVPALLKQVQSSVPERRAATIDALRQIAPTALEGIQ